MLFRTVSKWARVGDGRSAWESSQPNPSLGIDAYISPTLGLLLTLVLPDLLYLSYSQVDPRPMADAATLR